MLEKLFHLKENHTNVKTEVIGGFTTFMTMAYILWSTMTLPCYRMSNSPRTGIQRESAHFWR